MRNEEEVGAVCYEVGAVCYEVGAEEEESDFAMMKKGIKAKWYNWGSVFLRVIESLPFLI